MNYLWLLVATLLLVASNSVVAESGKTFQFDDVIYTLPDGWKKGKTRDDFVTIYNSNSGFRTMRIFRSDKVPRSINRWVNKKIRSVIDNDAKIDKDNGDQLLPKETAGKLKAYLSSRVAGRDALVGLSTVGKERINFVLLKARVPRSKEDGEVFKARLTNEFLPFARGFKYISQGAKPVLGKPVAGELDGTFSGLQYTYNLDLSANFDQDFYSFSHSGHFVRGLPIGVSVKAIAFEEAARKKPNKAGNYRIRGGKIHFDFADGSTKVRDYKQTKSGFKMGHNFTPVKIPQDGAKFDGHFADLHYTGFTPGIGNTGGVAQARSIRFTRSGRYTSTQFSSASATFQNTAGNTTGGFTSSSKRPKGNGTYEVTDGTLRLKDSAGRVTIHSLVQIGERLIYVDGNQYLKSDAKEDERE